MAVLVFFLVFGAVVQGAVIDVTTTLDKVPGSLRAAIITANSNGEDGGGIYNNDTLSLTSCSIINNRCGKGNPGNFTPWACECPGGGGHGGGIYNSGSLTLTGCTIADNSAGQCGGAIDCCNVPGGGHGGGIYNFGPSRIVYIKNTIVANNQVKTGGEGADAWGIINSQGYNLIENPYHYSITGVLSGNITGVDPMLGPLADNGGLTQTHALLPGSPCIDAGNSSGIPQDQRGVTRPVDIPGIVNVSDGADIGAYERENFFKISGTITYGETGLSGVTLTFSNNGDFSTTDKQGNYSHAVPAGWSGTVTPSYTGYYFSPVNRGYTSVSMDKTNQDFIAVPAVPPRISLNRTYLNFGANPAGHQTGSQRFLINNSGGGILDWSISDNAQWLSCTPTSGTGPALVNVSISRSGLAPGTYTGTITVAAPNANNSPRFINVTLIVYPHGALHLPFGYFDTPIDGSTVMSSISVSGWVLDNLGIQYVKIFRKPAAGEGSGLVYIGDAVLVEGARPDVEAAYPDYPDNYKAGWGYNLLTNGLPNQGNGTFTIYAKAADKEGNIITIGTKTIKCDNINVKKPFGAIDTPEQGGTASGRSYVNFGWALTPLPNTIPKDGSTITVWVDGVPIGHPVYNRYRNDIAVLFPGYNNSAGAGGHFYLDTHRYENGVHTIAWSVKDNAGNIDGIGSRYFIIQNTGGTASVSQNRSAVLTGEHSMLNADIRQISPDDVGPIHVKKGYNPGIEPKIIYPDESGNITIEIRELERIEIHFPDPGLTGEPRILNIFPLPIGAAVDQKRGVFYWQPGPGYLGFYELVVIEQIGDEVRQRLITVGIKSKFE